MEAVSPGVLFWYFMQVRLRSIRPQESFCPAFPAGWPVKSSGSRQTIRGRANALLKSRLWGVQDPPVTKRSRRRMIRSPPQIKK